MNYVDILIVLMLIFAVIRGADVGFVRQAGGLLGLWIGLALGSWIVSSATPGTTAAIVILLACIVFGVIGGELAGIKIKELLHEHKINVLDRVFGGVIGVLTGLVVIWLASTLITVVSATSIQQAVRDSAIIRYLDQTLPPATEAIASLETYITNAGIPELVKTEEPKLTEASGSLPVIETFSASINQARPSTLEIEGRSCSGIEVGSGFVADNELVITNAHVVAGMRTPFVRDVSGKRYKSEVVAFDPALDLAVLRVTGLSNKPLVLYPTEVPKNTPAVVLGYPGGKSFTARPAVVADTFRAIGKDIYGEEQVNRTIYALRANVEKGNSGGPLINKDGAVIGVIFARSTAYDKIGYAITMPNVLPVLEQAKTDPDAGQSLRCL